MKQLRITVTNEVGLHARPASVFVQAAKQFASQISIRNVTRNNGPADAKSILSLLVLGVEKNHEVEITAEGDDEDQAIAYLDSLINSGFAEAAGNA